MPKVKILVTLALLAFVGNLLYQKFIFATHDQGGAIREFADKSKQGLEDYKKALAESRNSPSQVLDSDEAVSEAPSLKFPQATCGDNSSTSNKVWYPVFIDGGNLQNVQRQYCNDAIATTRKDTGVATVQLASFDSRDKALAFAKQVGGEVGEPTITQPSSGTPDPSQSIQQEEQSTLEAQVKKQKARQKIIEATNLCQEKYLKFQKQSNELRKSTASYAQNPMTDFADSIAESHDQLAKAELQSCLTKAQLQGEIRAGE